MKGRLLAAAVVALAVAAPSSIASGPTAVYSLIDKVIVEPGTETPGWVEIWGAFVVATGGVAGAYDPPRRGYLYLSAPEGRAGEQARIEWAELAGYAGKRQVIAFARAGSPQKPAPVRVRAAGEPRANPDVFQIWGGTVVMRGDTDYEPVQSLLRFAR